MSTYQMTCDKCGLEYDVRCAMKERNDPKPCVGIVPPAEREAAGCDGTGTLSRGDTLETTAFTPYSWKP